MDRPLIPLGYDSIAPLLSLGLEGGAYGYGSDSSNGKGGLSLLKKNSLKKIFKSIFSLHPSA
jgi:hypothetical protein